MIRVRSPLTLVLSAILATSMIAACGEKKEAEAGEGAETEAPTMASAPDSNGLTAQQEADSARVWAAEAKIDEATARATALAAVPGGVFDKFELEREDGNLIYSYDIKVAGKEGIEEVHIDAITGKLLKQEHEGEAEEAGETGDEG